MIPTMATGPCKDVLAARTRSPSIVPQRGPLWASKPHGAAAAGKGGLLIFVVARVVPQDRDSEDSDKEESDGEEEKPKGPSKEDIYAAYHKVRGPLRWLGPCCPTLCAEQAEDVFV